MIDNLLPRVGHILRLAEIIREVDGSHSLGASALAEAILSHPRFSQCHEPTPPPAEGEVAELAEWLRNHASARGRLQRKSFLRAAELLQRQLPEPAPPEPVSIPENVKFQFLIFDEDYVQQASGEASSYEEALKEGYHYLNQYSQDGTCMLELSRIEVLFTTTTSNTELN